MTVRFESPSKLSRLVSKYVIIIVEAAESLTFWLNTDELDGTLGKLASYTIAGEIASTRRRRLLISIWRMDSPVRECGERGSGGWYCKIVPFVFGEFLV